MFTIYVLKNEETGKIYIGQTSNIDARLRSHNTCGVRRKTSYTFRNKGVWKLVYKEDVATRQEALIREKQLKSHRGRDYIRSILVAVAQQ